jgi:type IV secretory pathway VirD2 relaxase
MENDLGTDLEWIAVAHHNTEHPHLHMVIRGVGSDGPADSIKAGLHQAWDSRHRRGHMHASDWISYKPGCCGRRTPGNR